MLKITNNFSRRHRLPVLIKLNTSITSAILNFSGESSVTDQTKTMVRFVKLAYIKLAVRITINCLLNR